MGLPVNALHKCNKIIIIIITHECNMQVTPECNMHVTPECNMHVTHECNIQVTPECNIQVTLMRYSTKTVPPRVVYIVFDQGTSLYCVLT